MTSPERSTRVPDQDPGPHPAGEVPALRDTSTIADNLQWVTEPALAYLALDELLNEMLRRVVEILEVDTSAILLLEPDGETLAARAAMGLEEEVRRRFRLPVGHGFAGRVAATRQPVVIEEVGTSAVPVVNPVIHARGVRSLLGVPLIVEGRLIGVLHVGSLGGRGFDEDDIHLLQTVADRVALAIDHRRLGDQHRIAQALQASLLPPRLPAVPGFALAARYLPATSESAVGGDWYDVIDLGHDRIGLALGDVAGHGLLAATFMGEVRSALRAYALEEEAPGAVLTKLGRFVAHKPGRMVTLLYATVHLGTGLVRYARAGHPYPLLLRREGADYLEDGGGPPLSSGLVASYDDDEFSLATGETVFLYSDGLIERRGELLSQRERDLAEAVAGGPREVEAMCDDVIARMVGDDEIEDDVAILAVANTGLGDRIELAIDPRTDELPRLRALLRRWLAGHPGVGGRDLDAIALAVTEACTNAIEHGFSPGEERIAVTGVRERGSAAIEVRDRGRWREPRGGDRGRGIPLMREFMSEVEIKPTPGGTTVRFTRIFTGDDR